jgi:hypothetical protein
VESSTDKRACERRSYAAPAAFSYFNKEQFYEAQTINHCAGGLRFKSEVFLQPGATVFIKVKKLHPNDSGSDGCQGLRSVTLAEVKWCKAFTDETEPFYEVGARYYEPDY